MARREMTMVDSYQQSRTPLPRIEEDETDSSNNRSGSDKSLILGGILCTLVSLFAITISMNRGRPQEPYSMVKSDLLLGKIKSRKSSSTQAMAGLQLSGYPTPEVQLEYEQALEKIDWDAVEMDINDVMMSSQKWWPADYQQYSGLFVRLSWHSCGSYRESDGRGGCDGGGQRFDPERSWPDNTNLDKARRLLEPIKQKYGIGLSWGDLFALSGTVAIKSMGGPSLGFCAGRIDMIDNSQTLPLGPTREQEEFAECPVNGQCPFPLGQNTLGLIYVNPEGPMGEPDPQGAADTVRDVFGRMDWHGRELVALIGGGHTFGKAHGASMSSPGVPPNECPFASWDGPTGADAITSGFEGPWTAHPTRWDNDYFKYLIDYEWEPVKSPAGKWQWQVKGADGPKAPTADSMQNATQNVMMLTTDVALVVDPEYKLYVQEFASNLTALEEAFGYVWYKLITRDMGPITRCAGYNSAPPQHFQQPLPDTKKSIADIKDVAKHVHKLVHKNPNGEFIRLATQCANTYRATDYQGGCNGARIRFPPGSEWPINAGLDKTLALLEPVKAKYGNGLSYADLIVLAGGIAAERMGAPDLTFCPGRVDATDGKAWKGLAYGNTEAPTTVDSILELARRRGQTPQDIVTLTFTVYKGSTKGLKHVLNRGNSDNNTVLESGLIFYPELRYWAEHYISAGDKEYGRDFAASWTKLMNADRFDGPVRNACAM